MTFLGGGQSAGGAGAAFAPATTGGASAVAGLPAVTGVQLGVLAAFFLRRRGLAAVGLDCPGDAFAGSAIGGVVAGGLACSCGAGESAGFAAGPCGPSDCNPGSGRTAGMEAENSRLRERIAARVISVPISLKWLMSIQFYALCDAENPERRLPIFRYQARNQALGLESAGVESIASSLPVSRIEGDRGMRNRNVVPWPSTDSNSTEPLCHCKI